MNPINIDDVFRLISGHSIYSGDSILSAFVCISEGKKVNTIEPLDITYAEIADMRGETQGGINNIFADTGDTTLQY